MALHPDQRIFNDRKGRFIEFRRYHKSTSEAAECRKHAVVFGKIKTGEGEILSSFSFDADARVHMPGKRIPRLILRSQASPCLQIVHKKERTEVQFIFMHGNIGFLVPFFFEDVMIAPDQVNLQCGKIMSPPDKEFKFLIHPAVGHISHDDQPVSFEKIKLAHQALEVGPVNVLRNGNAFFSEMTRLSQVQVRNDQGVFFFPVKTSFRGYPECIFMNDMGNRISHRD